MATASANTTTLAAALLETVTPQEYGDACYKDYPLLAMLPKSEDWYGEPNRRVPLAFAPTGGGSATFTNAQSSKNASKNVKFELVRKSDYSLWSLSGEVIEASQNDTKSLLKAGKHEFMMAMRTASRSLATKLYGNGGGALARSSSTWTVASTTITLANADDISAFEVGMTCQLSDTDGTSGSVRTGSFEIVGIDRDTGTITAAATVGGGGGTITAAAQSDYIFRAGDFGGAIAGLAGWIPSTAPGSTAFRGVDRTQDLTRLAGVRFDGTAYPIEEAIIRALARTARNGARPTHGFMNPVAMGNLLVEMGSKAVRTEGKVGSLSFDGVKIYGGGTVVEMFSDFNCPVDRIYLLTMSTWMLHTLGKAPKVLNGDGVGDTLREYNADAYEGRIGYRGDLGCNNPGANCVVLL